MKNFKGKAIYNPLGKAGEYSYWACNFYNGCSNGCTYCFNKTGRFKSVLGGDKPTLKKCFKDDEHALQVFEKELLANLPELQKHGLFFTFTSDPMLIETIKLNAMAISCCVQLQVPVKILTKCVGFVDEMIEWGQKYPNYKDYEAIGFTLTGHDELEPNASPNAERIEAMQKLHEAGFNTWASIEPVIDFESSKAMIEACWEFCDLFKVGLESGKKYDKKELVKFLDWSIGSPVFQEEKVKFYLKDSLLKQAGVDRADLPTNCVGRDYNIFNNQNNKL